MALLPTRVVARRYSVVGRSIDRWIDNPALGFPKPIRINGRNYFDEAELDEFDKRRALARDTVAV